MQDEIKELYTTLCSQLGETEKKISDLKQKAKQIRKRIENVEWVNASVAPKPEPVKPEIVQE